MGILLELFRSQNRLAEGREKLSEVVSDNKIMNQLTNHDKAILVAALRILAKINSDSIR